MPTAFSSSSVSSVYISYYSYFYFFPIRHLFLLIPVMPQVTVMTLIALWFRQVKEEREHLPELQLRRELLESLQRLPISFGMGLRTREICKKVFPPSVCLPACLPACLLWQLRA